ncbi:MAG: hypothetical protein A3H51_02990 [Candidatus Spechtbacteria bacterium RIFCSPLOWO2_02_FULL_38_8]|uniref:Uncharacterized protein n=1 Tax=Candidatus Spechtbacteria bacterium RIFCSPLOWO2_02_FULL_38_8 TaxID=1802164 RepID=A0A1G2HLP2_9BACT|nr:MAG: hypothetical protein A3H51_02990 [Candidatus Spechtbacteria bacterium RIFCSPLOWO2_02_FULL_38_8]
MKKRATVIFVLIALVSLVTACGGDDESSQNQATTTTTFPVDLPGLETTTTTTSTDTSTDTTVTTSANDADVSTTTAPDTQTTLPEFDAPLSAERELELQNEAFAIQDELNTSEEFKYNGRTFMFISNARIIKYTDINAYVLTYNVMYIADAREIQLGENPSLEEQAQLNELITIANKAHLQLLKRSTNRILNEEQVIGMSIQFNNSFGEVSSTALNSETLKTLMDTNAPDEDWFEASINNSQMLSMITKAQAKNIEDISSFVEFFKANYPSEFNILVSQWLQTQQQPNSDQGG